MEGTSKSKDKEQANYFLPVDLITAVEHQAVSERRRPGHVAEDALRQYLDRQRPRKRTTTAPK